MYGMMKIIINPPYPFYPSTSNICKNKKKNCSFLKLNNNNNNNSSSSNKAIKIIKMVVILIFTWFRGLLKRKKEDPPKNLQDNKRKRKMINLLLLNNNNYNYRIIKKLRKLNQVKMKKKTLTMPMPITRIKCNWKKTLVRPVLRRTSLLHI